MRFETELWWVCSKRAIKLRSVYVLIAVFDRPQRGNSGHEMSHHYEGLPSNAETDHTIDKAHHGSGDHHDIMGHLVPHKDIAVDSDERRRIGSGDHGNHGADRMEGICGEFIGQTHTDRLKNKSKSTHAPEDQQQRKNSDSDELVYLEENNERLKNMDAQQDIAPLEDNRRNYVTRAGDRHALPERDMHVHLIAAKHTEEVKSSQQKKRRSKRNGRLHEGETQINCVGASATDVAGHTCNKRQPITDASKKKATRRNSGQLHREDMEQSCQPGHSNASKDDSGKQSLCHPARSQASPTPCVASAVGQVCLIYLQCQLAVC